MKFTYLQFFATYPVRYRESVLGDHLGQKDKIGSYKFSTILGHETLERHKETINKLENTAEDLNSLRNVRISNLRFPDREITELFDKLGTV